MNTTSISSSSAAQQALAHRLRRLAFFIRSLLALGISLMLCMPLLVLWGPDDWLRDLLGGQTSSVLAQVPQDIGMPLRWRLVGAQLPALTAALLAQFWLWRLFGRYRLGDVFSLEALGHLRRFAWSLALLPVAEPLSRTLGALAITLDSPPGQRMLVISFGSYEYALMLVALVFVAIARVMAEAARVAEENAQFV